MITKSFRISEDRLGKLEKLQRINNITMHDVITTALDNYFISNLEDCEIEMDKVANIFNDSNMIPTEYMYIPLEYYAMFNDITKRDVEVLIHKKEIKSVALGCTQLIMIDINEAIYRKAELLIIKNNINSITKNQRTAKSEAIKHKKQIENLKDEIKLLSEEFKKLLDK